MSKIRNNELEIIHFSKLVPHNKKCNIIGCKNDVSSMCYKNICKYYFCILHSHHKHYLCYEKNCNNYVSKINNNICYCIQHKLFSCDK